MKEYQDLDNWQPPESGCAIALGRFDGVHLGHRALLNRAVEHAAQHNLIPVCFSFQEKTFPGSDIRGLLTTCDEKAALLEEIGIQVLLHPSFEKPLIDMDAGDFFKKLLVDKWNAKLIVAGYDFRFGKDRGGSSEFMKEEGARYGVEVEIFEKVSIGETAVKATRIRELIGDGKISEANSLLGRPYSITSTSNTGKQFGRTIGFPTINFNWPEFKVRIPHGIYAVTIIKSEQIPGKCETESNPYMYRTMGIVAPPMIDSERMKQTGGVAPPHPAPGSVIETSDRRLKAVANFGLRPTVEPENQQPLLEVHILDEFPESYRESGQEYVVEILEKLRDEEKFGSTDELKDQISKDCEAARVYFRNNKNFS